MKLITKLNHSQKRITSFAIPTLKFKTMPGE